jgi:tRNA-modifying protein YgfZ
MTSLNDTRGYAALRGGAGLVERTDTGRIVLTGADRRSYLQGLLTNDIEALTPGTGCYAAMLTAQGRMITDMRVLELGDAVQLDVPRALTQAVYDHLDRFVFSEDVKVADVTGGYAEIGLYGPAARDVLVRAGTEGAAPDAMYAVTRIQIAGADARLVRSDDFGVPGFGIIVASADAATVMAALASAGGVPAEESDLETVRIESGRPRFGADLDTDVIPLEAGLEARAISRSKGCYVGQEVIVRVQDRGQGRVARRLVGLTLDPAAPIPERGAPIEGAGRGIGRVTSAAWSPSLARPIALGYVHRDFVEAGTQVLVGGSAGLVVGLPIVAAVTSP